MMKDLLGPRNVRKDKKLKCKSSTVFGVAFILERESEKVKATRAELVAWNDTIQRKQTRYFKFLKSKTVEITLEIVS